MTLGLSIRCACKSLDNLRNDIFVALITFSAGLSIYLGNGLIFM